jgi:TonB family protein
LIQIWCYVFYISVFAVAALALGTSAFCANKLDETTMPPSITNSKFDWSPYMMDMQRRIQRAWFPPKEHEPRAAVVAVVFRLHKDGTVTDLRIPSPSKFAIANEEALKAVTNAAPYRPLPDVAQDSFEVEYRFDFYGLNDGTRMYLRRI